MQLLKKDEYKKAASIVEQGGLIAFPTETVFGLGVIFDKKSSYDNLVDVKRRPPEKPFTLMCGDVSDVYKYGIIDERADKLIRKYMPGQFTIIVKAKEGLPSWVVSKEGYVGMRVPDDEFVKTLINEVGKPLLVPSANRSGEKPLNNSNDVLKIFSNDVDVIIEGESKSAVPSTIVLIGSTVEVIREGLISKAEIYKTLED